MKLERTLQAASNATCAAIGIFMGLAIADFTGDQRVETVRDWQGLIGGVLAVAAAYLTVQQMRISDGQHQLRHSELIEAQRRREQRIARRAGGLFVVELRAMIDSVRKQRDLVTEETLMRDFFTSAARVGAIHANLKRIVSRPSLAEARSLFEPETDHFLSRATEYIDSIAESLQPMHDVARAGKIDQSSAQVPLWYLDEAIECLTELANQLEALDRQYG